MTVRTEHATYTEADGIVRAPGPVEFSRGRMSGSGIGMTYDKNQDVLTHPRSGRRADRGRRNAEGAQPPMQLTAARPRSPRRDNVVRFERAFKMPRGAEMIEADTGVAHLTADEDRLEALELRGNSRITAAAGPPGACRR